MNVARKANELRFTFNLMECRILLRVLRAITRNYALAPEELDPRSREAWYSGRGCRSAGFSEEETIDWLKSLHQFKGARLHLVEQWYAQLTRTSEGSSRLRVALDDAPALLSALNDHRLLMAARHEIGQTEMDTHDLNAAEKLGHQKQAALLEIHFLAWIIEEILAQLAERPENWNSEPDAPESTS